jgi:hypothetical protein
MRKSFCIVLNMRVTVCENSDWSSISNLVFGSRIFMGYNSYRNRVTAKMDILKSLIIGWSGVWAFCLYALSNLKSGLFSPIYGLFLGEAGRTTWEITDLPLFAILYAFIPWILGCILIVLFAWAFRWFWK